MNDEITYEFDGKKMPASKAIEEVIKSTQNMDAKTAEAYINFYSNLFNHTIIITEKRQSDQMSTKKIVAIIGLIGLTMMIILVIYNPFATKWQSLFLWVPMCLFTAACCSLIPGFFNIKISNWITASGAIGIFILMYLNKPAVSGDDYSNPSAKLIYFIAKKDTSSIAEIPIEFTPTSGENICEFSNKAIASYFGENIQLDTFAFFRKSDGKIYLKERCNDIAHADREIIGISSKILHRFNNKRDAYDHFLSITLRK